MDIERRPRGDLQQVGWHQLPVRSQQQAVRRVPAQDGPPVVRAETARRLNRKIVLARPGRDRRLTRMQAATGRLVRTPRSDWLPLVPRNTIRPSCATRFPRWSVPPPRSGAR